MRLLPSHQLRPIKPTPSNTKQSNRDVLLHMPTLANVKNSRESCARPVNLASRSITQELQFGKYNIALKNTEIFCRGFMDFKQETLQFRQGCNLVSRESHYQCINHVIIYKTDNHVINRYCRQCVEYNYTRILRQVRNAR